MTKNWAVIPVYVLYLVSRGYPNARPEVHDMLSSHLNRDGVVNGEDREVIRAGCVLVM